MYKPKRDKYGNLIFGDGVLYSQHKREKDHIHNLQNEINTMKNELAEIRDMLKGVLSND